MLLDSVRQFAEAELQPIAGKIDQEKTFPREQVLRAGEQRELFRIKGFK